MDKELQGLQLSAGSFGFRQVKAATRHFLPSTKIGEGGFGSVYKGSLPVGFGVAVKLLSSVSNQGNHEFLNEVSMTTALQHPNLVKLFECCIEGCEEGRLKLDWP